MKKSTKKVMFSGGLPELDLNPIKINAWIKERKLSTIQTSDSPGPSDQTRSDQEKNV